MQAKFCRLLIAGAFLAVSPAHAQDVLMAKGNTQITLSLSPVNYHEKGMKADMSWFKQEHDELKQFDYALIFSKPLSITAEYALSSYTTVGINANYFSFDLSELREDAVGTMAAKTTGSHLDLHARVVRYFFATPGSSMYLLGEIGISKRSIQYSGGTDGAAYINTFPETAKDGNSIFSYDYGIGLRFRIFGSLGVSAELTALSPTGRYGLFYIIKPAGRRSKDQIGW